MNEAETSRLPSLDAVLRAPAATALTARFGRVATTAALRETLAEHRDARRFVSAPAPCLTRRPMRGAPLRRLPGDSV